MTFWGVEVKPGKPITHSCEKARGRLRISQATLGFGESLNKSVVQCNVGNRSPVLLCVLLPGQVESSHIELEFMEADDVVFSVIGPRSVYLTGYYVHQNRQSNSRSDTESYGVDIENTDGSNYNSDGEFPSDGYEDSFISDDQLQFSPGSPVFYSKGLDEDEDEIMPENDEWKDKKARSKLRKKRKLVIESDEGDDDDDDANSPEKEDEDDFSLSLHESQKDVKTTTCDAGEKIDQLTVEMDDEAKDDDICGETKQNVEPLDISDKIERVTQSPLDEEGIENNEKNETHIEQNLPIIDEKDKMQPLDLAKPKKKRKELPMPEKSSEVQADNEDPSVHREHKEHESEASADLMGVGEDHLVTAPELDSADSQKSKKRRNEVLEGELIEGTDEKFRNNTEDYLSKQDSLHVDGVTENLPAANGENELQQKPEETSMEKRGVESYNVQSGDEVHADSKTTDLQAANEENEKDQIDSNVRTKVGKIKKKKKKTQGKKDLNMSATTQMSVNQVNEDESTKIATQMSVNQVNEDESTKIVPVDTRTLSNGLTIEELGRGPPDGKVAVSGKMIKIFYTGMLKESGTVYDSNVGKSAFKFRLGDEEYIDGWNIGIDGMRVGDKRRLIIPPSMGFGDIQVGDNIPPNSWLIYDIELVKVFR